LVIHHINPNEKPQEISVILPFDSIVAWLILQEDFSTIYVEVTFVTIEQEAIATTCLIVFILCSYRIHIVAYMITERTVEPEKQP
jgi:hypothetical protein